jgi:predicted enzyme related to lactoylglutathione lyase
MTHGMRTIIYPVTDITRRRALFRALLGADPYPDEPYYVGFRAGDQEIGLDPHGHRQGMTGYWHVSDIRATLQSLLDAGAEAIEDPKDVCQGRLIASVRDPDGNIIGLLQLS